MHPLNKSELDRILDKISASGIQSLTQSERAFLERFSQRH
jgi:type IV pilus biogenesis protein CpaD/CtpE